MGIAVATGKAPSVGGSVYAAEAAVAELYQSHCDWVLARCRAWLRSREEAEDAMQVTFIQAFRALRRGIVPEHELAWLGTIADNVCKSSVRDAMRNARREASAERELRCAEPAFIDDGSREEVAALKRALRRLPETQRRAILLREWTGMSTKEIALELETSVTAVDMLLHRARRTLSIALGEARWRRAFDVTSLAAALRQLLSGGGGAAAKVAAAASAIAVATTGVAASAPDSTHALPDPRNHVSVAHVGEASPASLPPTPDRTASPVRVAKRTASVPAPASGAEAAASPKPAAAQPTESASEPGGPAPAAPSAPASAAPIASPEAAAQPAVAEPQADQPIVELPAVQIPELPAVGVPIEPAPVALPVPAEIEPPALPEVTAQLPLPPLPPVPSLP